MAPAEAGGAPAPGVPPHVLLRQDAARGYWRASFVEDVSLDALRAGVPMDAPPGPVAVTVSALSTVPSDFIELPCLLVSPALRRALDGAGVDNVQYFPAQLRMEYAEEVVAEYWAANVVGAVACAVAYDDALPPEPAPPLGPAPPFRIDPARARGLDLFRLAEDRQLLVVSARVAEAIRAAGLRGLVLQDPAQYNGLPVQGAPPAPTFADAALAEAAEDEVGTRGG